MRTAETLDTHRAWSDAQERRRRCARPGCTHERMEVGSAWGFCFACTLEAELFDRDARWESVVVGRSR